MDSHLSGTELPFIKITVDCSKSRDKVSLTLGKSVRTYRLPNAQAFSKISTLFYEHVKVSDPVVKSLL